MQSLCVHSSNSRSDETARAEPHSFDCEHRQLIAVHNRLRKSAVNPLPVTPARRMIPRDQHLDQQVRSTGSSSNKTKKGTTSLTVDVIRMPSSRCTLPSQMPGMLAATFLQTSLRRSWRGARRLKCCLRFSSSLKASVRIIQKYILYACNQAIPASCHCRSRAFDHGSRESRSLP
jgi:hypothetical protein